MSIAMLEKQIKTGDFANLYIIYGDEDYLKSYYCKKITDKAVTNFESFNLQRFDGIPDMAQLAAAVNNLPLMSAKKCVVLRDTDLKGMKAGDWKELQNIITSLPPKCSKSCVASPKATGLPFRLIHLQKTISLNSWRKGPKKTRVVLIDPRLNISLRPAGKA